MLILICGTTEVDEFDFDIFWAVPHTFHFLSRWHALIIAGVFIAFLGSIYLNLVLYLQGPERFVRDQIAFISFQEYILWFEVSVSKLVGMKELQSSQTLSCY